MSVNVIVVPQTEEWSKDLLYDSQVYININLGRPKLEDRNVKYLAPFWVEDQVVSRVYHIVEVIEEEEKTVIRLGNSFILKDTWNNMKNRRRFEYHSLKDFSLIEIKEGILMHYNF